MYNGRFTNIDEIIEKVSRYGLSDFNIEEAKEWTWEILSQLGVPSIYIKKKALLEVANGRTFIPIDCADLTESQLRDYYTHQVITKSTDTFFPSVTDAEVYLAEFPPFLVNLKSLTYDINNSQFIFGFDSGIIELSYMSFPIDSNGDPMIPDNAKCIRAVVLYILRMIAFRMNLADLLSDRKFDKIEQKSMWATSSARSAMNLETIDDWENVVTNFMRLRRDINQKAIGYKTMSVRENLSF